MEFENEEDLEYYMNDSAHIEVHQSLIPLVETPFLVDFTPGVF